MNNPIDRFLNLITMYRLVLYVLIILLAAAFLFSWFGLLPMSPWLLLFSVAFILAVCILANETLAKIFLAPVNAESVYITALILALLITPPQSFLDGNYLEMAFWASLWAIASKFIFAIRRKHIFNPASFGVAVTALTLNQAASWWVGTLPLLPFVVIGGLLIVRKVQRFDLFWSFLIVGLISIAFGSLGFIRGFGSVGVLAWRSLAFTPILFFGSVMVTEPLTMSPKRTERVVYGALVGFLNAPWMHFGSLYLTPELALLIGNIYTYIVSPKEKLLLTLTSKEQVADGVYHFRFSKERALPFLPGQYLEWTLPLDCSDTRGNRRFLTIASSPTEKELAIGVKFYPQSSTFKQKLLAMEPGATIVASQKAGEFTMPKDPTRKLAFIAGGIGITPFRSMVQYLVDQKEKRDVVLLYSNRTSADIAYRDVFDAAEKKIGMKTVYTLTDRASVPKDWQGLSGYFDASVIRHVLPDYSERYFYISGTHAMVAAMEQALHSLGVYRSHIHKDFFPGFA